MDWTTVAFATVLPLAICALGSEYYWRAERGPLRNARTVGFAAGVVVAIIALAFGLWAPSPTAKTIGFVYAIFASSIGARFQWLADKAERRSQTERGQQDAELRDTNRKLLVKISSLEALHFRELHNVRDRAAILSTDLNTFGYALKQSGGQANAIELWTFRDRVLEVIQAFGCHAISDQSANLLLSMNYLDLDKLADGIDRMLMEADNRMSGKTLTAGVQQKIDALARGERANLRRDARKVAEALLNVRSAHYQKVAEIEIDAAGADVSYQVALAEMLACFEAKNYAIDIETLFEHFRTYKVAATQPPPMEWVRSPESMSQVLAVESALSEMANLLN